MVPGLDRYRELVDDWDAFVSACTRPLPLCGWRNPLRLDNHGAIRQDGFDLLDLAWRRGAFRVQAGPSMTRSIGYRAGLFHVQEEASLVPVALLRPSAGERILDLCAAPGNKTAEIATAMGGAGTLVANDPSRARLNVLRTTLDRLGLPNVTVTALDGRSLEFPDDHFDAVLVDAPCSCDGTLRKHPGIVARTGERERTRLVRKQKALLLNALRVVRPGGRVVYSTCSFSPEENEMVVEAALAEHPDVFVGLAELPGLAASDSVQSWTGQALSVRGALRLWPHRVDSGGFFAAKLIKGEATDSVPVELGSVSHPNEPGPVIDFLHDYYGLREIGFGPNARFLQSKNVLRLVAGDHDPGWAAPALSSGIAVVRLTGRIPKLTTQGALLLGNRVTRQWVDVGREHAFAFMRGEDVKPSAMWAPKYGYVQVRSLGTPIGVGLFDPRSGVLESKYPRSWAGLAGPPKLTGVGIET